jgi:hypothetical protein
LLLLNYLLKPNFSRDLNCVSYHSYSSDSGKEEAFTYYT